MAVILIILVILLLVLIGWMWNTLGTIEKSTKIKCIIIGLIILYLFTFILYSISSIDINYQDISAIKIFKNVYVLLFTIVNGYFLLPFIFKRLEQINSEEIERDKLKRYIFILLIALIILAIVEVNYFANVQHRINTSIQAK